MKTIKISEASAEQLRTFASASLGIEVHPNSNRETLISKISAAYDKDEIPVGDADDGDQPLAGAPPRPVTDRQASRPKKGYVRIHIHVTEDPGGNEPVPVGVNGKAMLIPRGEDVDIKEEYFEVLKNAVQHKYEMMPDGKSINPNPRKVPLYPFMRVA